MQDLRSRVEIPWKTTPHAAGPGVHNGRVVFPLALRAGTLASPRQPPGISPDVPRQESQGGNTPALRAILPFYPGS